MDIGVGTGTIMSGSPALGFVPPDMARRGFRLAGSLLLVVGSLFPVTGLDRICESACQFRNVSERSPDHRSKKQGRAYRYSGAVSLPCNVSQAFFLPFGRRRSGKGA